MSQLPQSELLDPDTEGGWRLAGTRVSLDSVVQAFRTGATPEEICQDFPSLTLARVYAAIAYYLEHRDQIDAYLRDQQQAAAQLHQTLNARHEAFLTELRQRLANRQQSLSSA